MCFLFNICIPHATLQQFIPAKSFRIQSRAPIAYGLKVSYLILIALFSCLCSSKESVIFYSSQKLKVVTSETMILATKQLPGVRKLRIFQHTRCFDNGSNCHGVLIRKPCQDHRLSINPWYNWLVKLCLVGIGKLLQGFFL